MIVYLGFVLVLVFLFVLFVVLVRGFKFYGNSFMMAFLIFSFVKFLVSFVYIYLSVNRNNFSIKQSIIIFMIIYFCFLILESVISIKFLRNKNISKK